jgi:hypothetical protein
MQDVPVPSTPTYCTTTDVSQILREPIPPASSSEGEADVAYWNRAILAAEDQVDRTTKRAWRERRVTNEYPFAGLGNLPDPEGFILVPLRRAPLRDLATAAGDKLEVWNGSQYEDWLVTRTAGRAASWYANSELGQLHLRTRVILGSAHDRVRVTYRYGFTSVPAEVQRATALLAAADLATGRTVSLPGHGSGTDVIGADPRRRAWLAHAANLLAPLSAVEGL